MITWRLRDGQMEPIEVMADQPDQLTAGPLASWGTLAVPCVLGQPIAVTVQLSEPATQDIQIHPTSTNPGDTFQPMGE